jgi:hypothetical protein
MMLREAQMVYQSVILRIREYYLGPFLSAQHRLK